MNMLSFLIAGAALLVALLCCAALDRAGARRP